MKKLAVVLALALVFGLGSLVAQTFPDVPWDHWAYDAVATLAEKGIIVGYPDGYFKGDRPLTRYEFACALRNALERIKAEVTPPEVNLTSIQNAINDLKSRVAALEKAAPGGVPADLVNRLSAVEQQLQQAATKAELEAVRNQVAALQQKVAAIQISPEDIQTLRRLINEFRDELATLGVDVDEMRKDLDALTQRVVALEERVGKFSVSGFATYIVRGEKPKDVKNPPIDLNGVALKPNDKMLRNLFAGYDADVNMGFKVNDTTDISLAIWGRDWTNPSKMASAADTATIYKLYLTTTPMENAKLTVGKFPFQLTPYTLKLADPDVYTVIPKFDEGNYIVSGGKLDVDVKPAKVSLFAATNKGPADLRIVVPDEDVTVYQFAGARIELPNLIELIPSLGVTYYRAGLSGAGLVNPYVDVYGANIVIAPPVKNLSIVGEWAQMRAKDDTGALDIDEDNNAYDVAVAYAVTDDIKVKAGYKQVEQNFMTPGYWERILWERNLNNIKGAYGDISWTGLKNLALNIHGAFYEIDKGASAGDKINHYLAEVKYALTSKIGLQLGYEYKQYKPTAGAEDKLGYLTVGVSYELGKDAALKLLYQNIDLKWGAAPEQKGDLIVTQVSVKF
ncbi:S-layer homology domain-containing protein [bacterium]|nr:S-layer homology domain-containing protein [bacterium]